MPKGGRQPGAGRPLGSKNRKQFRDYWSEEEKQTYVEFVKGTYMEDPKLIPYVGDQLFGKATQAVEMTGADGGPIQVQGVEISVRKS